MTGMQTIGGHMRPSPSEGCNTGSGHHDALMMKQPSDTAHTPAVASSKRRRDHLRLVTEEPTLDAEIAAAIRPRTIGRLIAQTALIAETASMRRREERAAQPLGIAGRLMGRFRSV
jgi:hypothetical protein